MNPHDRKRRFNEAIVNMLFPSPPQPQHEQDQLEALIDGCGSDVISGNLDEYDNASTSGDEERDSEMERLTRAQRKKIRKKRMKEEAVHRGKGKLIGPLLPVRPTQVTEDAPAVRSNASEEGYDPACAKSVKLKHRRKAKRLAKEKRNASTSENSNQSMHAAFDPVN